MGCGQSIHRVYQLHPHLEKYRKQFEKLKLHSRDVGKLYEVFCEIDVNASGSIGSLELLAYLDIDKTSFTQRVFLLFDSDGSGEIDFCEFVVTTWNYCTLGNSTLTMFSFDLYDRDGSGILSKTEIAQMLNDNYGNSLRQHNHAKAVQQELNDLEEKGVFDIENFKTFAKFHQALLFPAFHIQSVLRRKVVGNMFWQVQTQRRTDMSQGKYIPISRFIVNTDLHVTKKQGLKSKLNAVSPDHSAHGQGMSYQPDTATLRSVPRTIPTSAFNQAAAGALQRQLENHDERSDEDGNDGKERHSHHNHQSNRSQGSNQGRRRTSKEIIIDQVPNHSIAEYSDDMSLTSFVSKDFTQMYQKINTKLETKMISNLPPKLRTSSNANGTDRYPSPKASQSPHTSKGTTRKTGASATMDDKLLSPSSAMTRSNQSDEKTSRGTTRRKTFDGDQRSNLDDEHKSVRTSAQSYRKVPIQTSIRNPPPIYHEDNEENSNVKIVRKPSNDRTSRRKTLG